MLKLLAAATLAFFSLAASADPVPPLGPVKLVLLKDLSTFPAFDLAPVPLKDCEVTTPADWRVVRCLVDGTRSVALGIDGQTFTLKKFAYFYKPMIRTADAWNEYHYTGDWTTTVNGVTLTSEATLLVWYTDTAPNDLRGHLSLAKYTSVAHALQGQRQ